MRPIPTPAPARLTARWIKLAGTMALLAGCGRAESPVSAAKPALATPDPREQALIEHTVRDRLAEEDRAREQALVNAREAASQRRVGVQMFRDLEEQYRQRRAAMANGGQKQSPTPAPPDVSAAASQP